MIGSLIGGLAGNNAQKKAIEAAGRAQAEGYAEAKALYNDPALVEQLKLEELLVGEEYNPYLIQPTDVGQSEMEGVTPDSELQQHRLNALDMLRQGAVTGMTPESRAAQNQSRAAIQRDIEAKQQQILQNMQARGLGGSGAELAMQIASSQQGADQASAESDRLAAMASQNALQSLAQYGNQAGSLQAQNIDLQQDKATAADEFNRFNIEGRRQAQQSNVGAQNRGQEYNIGRQNTVSDQNIKARNTELDNVRDLKWRKADSLGDLATGSGTARAGNAMALGGNKASLYGAIGGAVDQGAAAYMTGGLSGLVSAGGEAQKTKKMAHGGIVPGEAEVEGDHPINDKIPAMLSPGEIVIPRSIARSKDHEVVMDFIKALRSKEED